MARTLEDFTKLLLSLLPPSKAGFWTRSINSNLYKHAKGCSQEFARIDLRIEDLLHEGLVTEVSELLEEWEKDFGLPENGYKLADTTEGRLRELHAKFLEYGRQDVNYYSDIAAALGYTIEIEEFSPAFVGLMAAGDAVGCQENIFYWKVVIDLSCITSSKLVNISKLIYRIRKVKPAHTMVLFDFKGASFSRGFNKGFKSIPTYDNSWSENGFDRGFGRGFANAYDYDGVNYTGGFHQGFSIAFDRSSGGGFSNNAFDIGFKKPA